MKQTLLALLAMLIATFLSFNQKQVTIQNQSRVVRAELEQMGLGVAAQTMEVVRSRAFDSTTVGLPSDSIVATTDLTEPPFATQKYCEVFGGSTKCDDVDDFHNMKSATIPFEFPDHKFEFTVDIEVFYVNEDLQSTGGTRTYRKKVVIEVQDDPLSGGEPRMIEPIKYAEVISYP